MIDPDGRTPIDDAELTRAARARHPGEGNVSIVHQTGASPMDVLADKHTLRQRCLSALRAVPMEQRERFSAVLRAKMSAWLPKKTGAAVAIYAPLPHEVNLLPLLHESPGYRYLFPRCLPGRKMQFHHVTDTERDLLPGAHNILAPAEHCPLVAPQDIDLIIVPGVAFTADGHRLGYGGGYYDRFLPLCTKADMLALAFPGQILPTLPTEAHDLRIPQVITPLNDQSTQIKCICVD